MAKIKESTLARNPRTGEVEFLAKGSTAPAWAAQAITNPAVLDQPKPEETATVPEGGDGEQDGGPQDPPQQPEGGTSKSTTAKK